VSGKMYYFERSVKENQEKKEKKRDDSGGKCNEKEKNNYRV
jgi:hypothetical protein